MGELLIVLVVVLLIFGTKRLKTIGTDLGGAIKEFRSAVEEGGRGAAAEGSAIPGSTGSVVQRIDTGSVTDNPPPQATANDAGRALIEH